MPRLTTRPRAWREINEQLEYMEEQAGAEIAEQFLKNLIDSGQELARMPKMAALCGFKRPSLQRLRQWPVKGFENWLIFYQAKRDGIEIVHVIHGARNIKSLLGD